MTARTVLITGAAGGLGKDMAAHLASLGWSLLLLDRSATVHDLPTAAGIPAGHVRTLQLDLADREGLASLCTELAEGSLRCDALVNNAGVSSYSTAGQKLAIEEIDRNALELVLEVNLIAPFLLARAVLPGMRRRRWGRMVHIASRGGRTFSDVFPANFSASKAGLIALSRSIAGEAGKDGITSNVIAPGVIETPQSLKVDTGLLSQTAIPAGRVGLPHEISAAVAYLLSDAAAFTNGAVLDINGGAFMPS